MHGPGAAGEEFREDLRRPGSRNAQARRWLSAEDLAPLTRLSVPRTLWALGGNLAVIALAIAAGVWLWPGPGVLACVLVIGIAQHGLFILAHEAAHYRLFAHRGLNDAVGRLVGMSAGISMCTYRVTHRLHHNNLYSAEDPDTAIHGGYPRGRAYLLRKLALDITGLNAWKTFAYFFGAPAINSETRRSIRPLDDTSEALRVAARADRWWVLGLHLAAPLAAFALGGTRGLAMYAVFWMLPLLTVIQPILRLRAILEHGGVADLSSPLTAARCNRSWGGLANRVAGWVLFPHHVNYHLEHHLYPAVPHYRLPALHRLLRARGALDGAEVRDVADAWRIVFADRRPRHATSHP
ncbi:MULTISPECIES: fatty acid desaturase family protein [Ramlibacter]|uniref:Fatty acid desaturase family protein n=1 Tax=Ramlibacter aquaticus TaxID=2780094 RepID=A0ABR9SEL9_9BURK|nr:MULTISPECIES: fatty acid desaturase family protein [Ramlibacter]MBE7940806.1 fatty acid desaturase family protein [Ramlibacter aquaticus]